MRIGILSDTHDQVGRTTRAVAALQAEGAEILVHCGDLTGPEIVHECGLLTCHYVFGNNDFDEIGIRAAIDATGGVCLGYGGEFSVDGKRIAVTHGDSAREFRRLLAGMPDYLLFGHSHIILNERDGPTRQINPGALHRASSFTVALLDPEADDLRFLTIR